MQQKLLAILFATSVSALAADPTTTLWFDKPAASFHESLPLGNGRVGAMVFGGVDEERIVLLADIGAEGCEMSLRAARRQEIDWPGGPVTRSCTSFHC
jgi:hypothetical protein